MTDSQLRGGKVLKAFENNLLHVRLAVPISIFEIIKIWRAGHVHAAIPAHYTIWKSKAVRENRPFVVLAISIGILQQNDLAYRGLALARTSGIAAILHYKHPSFFVPGNCHW